MSCSLPPELLDLIVEHLRDEPTTLKACCIVSKSWISRIRKYLFARIRIRSPERIIQLWKQTFPDPSNSLAHYTRTIYFLKFDSSALASPDVVGWIRSFHHVEDLSLDFLGQGNYDDFHVKLRGFSSTLRSLSLANSVVALSRIFNFISSFPLLEDLALVMCLTNDTGEWISPSAPPRFTGSLRVTGVLPSIARWLCARPGGLHFRKIDLTLLTNETTSIMDLVLKCSNTLESLAISSCDLGAFIVASAFS